MKRRLIASMPFRYAGRPLRPGDEFDARSADVKWLTAMNRARVVPVSASVPPRSRYSTRVAVPEDRAVLVAQQVHSPATEASISETVQTPGSDLSESLDPLEAQSRYKRRYRRRDIKADEPPPEGG